MRNFPEKSFSPFEAAENLLAIKSVGLSADGALFNCVQKKERRLKPPFPRLRFRINVEDFFGRNRKEKDRRTPDAQRSFHINKRRKRENREKIFLFFTENLC